tara:strand:- start:1194 stop:1466 length:273 start_codon:yes stop_codon:yes gene_type:complete
MYEVLSVIGATLFVLFVVTSIWGNIFLLRKLLYFNENVNQVNISIDEFTRHLTKLHELPMYYGDENIQELLSHSMALKEEIVGFREAYKE